MGEAKRRKGRQAARGDELRAAVALVGHAIRRLAIAASGNLGSDCYSHAVLGQVLLNDLGFDARLAIGEAAWRIGPGDGDVISHTPRVGGYVPEGGVGFAYHAWLVLLDCVVNLTTYQLERKARDLDAADGGHTQVDWCPQALVIPLDQVKTYEAVAAAESAGVCFYLDRREIHDFMMRLGRLDDDDVRAARILLAHPETQVMGPNTLTGLT